MISNHTVNFSRLTSCSVLYTLHCAFVRENILPYRPALTMQFLFLLLSVIAARLITADAVNKVNVGFDFKLSYGTAAASSENGTLIGVVRVNTTESYRDTFKKLSLSSSTHYA